MATQLGRALRRLGVFIEGRCARGLKEGVLTPTGLGASGHINRHFNWPASHDCTSGSILVGPVSQLPSNSPCQSRGDRCSEGPRKHSHATGIHMRIHWLTGGTQHTNAAYTPCLHVECDCRCTCIYIFALVANLNAIAAISLYLLCTFIETNHSTASLLISYSFRQMRLKCDYH